MPQTKSAFILTKEEQELVSTHHNLIYSFLRKYNFSVEEYYDLAALAMCYAAHSYNPAKGAFSTYAYNAMFFRVARYIELQNTYSKAPPDPILSLDYTHSENTMNSDYNDEMNIKDVISSKCNVEEEAIANVCYENFLRQQTDRDKRLLSLFESGYNGPEVSQVMGYSKSNANMIRKALKEKYKKNFL